MHRFEWCSFHILASYVILRYTVANWTSLRNVTFHWLTSDHMQLASGFMLLAATGR